MMSNLNFEAQLYFLYSAKEYMSVNCTEYTLNSSNK